MDKQERDNRLALCQRLIDGDKSNYKWEKEFREFKKIIKDRASVIWNPIIEAHSNYVLKCHSDRDRWSKVIQKDKKLDKKLKWFLKTKLTKKGSTLEWFYDEENEHKIEFSYIKGSGVVAIDAVVSDSILATLKEIDKFIYLEDGETYGDRMRQEIWSNLDHTWNKDSIVDNFLIKRSWHEMFEIRNDLDKYTHYCVFKGNCGFGIDDTEKWLRKARLDYFIKPALIKSYKEDLLEEKFKENIKEMEFHGTQQKKSRKVM